MKHVTGEITLPKEILDQIASCKELKRSYEWTPEEDFIILEYYNKISCNDMSAVLTDYNATINRPCKRKPDAIYKRVGKLRADGKEFK